MDSAAFGFDVQRGDGPRSLTSAVLERLRSDILSTKLVPGQKLHIAGLAKQFSVSLAAVREALSRLVADGLVQASDQRGFRVSPVSPADLEDVTRTRIDIEGLALRRSIERGDQAWLNSVESSFAALCAVPQRDPGDPMKHNEVWIARHRIFHRALVNACMIDAERTYVVRQASDENYLRQLSYIAECMRTHEYGVHFDLAGCDGNAIPSPQTNEQCYRYDWRAKLGLPRSN